MNKHMNTMNTAEDYLAGTSQRDLAAGVLKQAAQDLRRFHGGTSAIERELYLDAFRWLTVDDCTWPFSFLNVCQLLNLAPESVREELLGDQALRLFRYWSRRCGRAARKLQISLGQFFTNEPKASTADPAMFATVVQ
jgi:hypothetical protein